MNKDRKRLFLTLVGNAFEHYDQILYYLLIPFIAPLFYSNVAYVFSLAIASLPFGILFRPVGVFYFTYLAQKKGIKCVLLTSMFGMGLSSLAIGLLPTFKTIGILSPIILSLVRGLICFFSTAEATAAPLYLFHHTEKKKHSFYSSIYEVSSMIGILVASLLISFLAFKGLVLSCWRILYFLGALTAFISLFFRYLQSNFELEIKPFNFQFRKLKGQFLSITTITFVTGFSCINYHVCMKMFNGYLPMVTNTTKEQMMFLHAILTFFDMCFLPFFGWLACRVGKGSVMKFCLVCIIIIALPLYQYVLANPTLKSIFLLRFILVFFGVGFAAPYQSYVKDISSSDTQFFSISTGKTIGKLFLSGPVMSLSYFILGFFGWKSFPIVYIAVSSLLCLVVMQLHERFSIRYKEAHLV